MNFKNKIKIAIYEDLERTLNYVGWLAISLSAIGMIGVIGFNWTAWLVPVILVVLIYLSATLLAYTGGFFDEHEDVWYEKAQELRKLENKVE